MKKLIALALAVTLLASMAVTVSAANTTTLTATVPAAGYTLNIPANQEVNFGTTQADIGNITVTDSAGFAVGKNLQVTVTYDAFSTDKISTQIPYSLSLYAKGSETNTGASAYHSATKDIPSGSALVFPGKASGAVAENILLETTYCNNSATKMIPVTSIRFNALSENWGKALAGEYSSTITFTTEVVVAE